MKLREPLSVAFAERENFQQPRVWQNESDACYTALFDAKDVHGCTIQRAVDVQFDMSLNLWKWRTRRRAAPGGLWYHSDESLAREIAVRIARQSIAECQARLWAAQSLAKIAT